MSIQTRRLPFIVILRVLFNYPPVPAFKVLTYFNSSSTVNTDGTSDTVLEVNYVFIEPSKQGAHF
jgi:hypothetical protein